MEGPYAAAWKKQRRRERLFWFGFFFYPLGAGLVGFALGMLLGIDPPFLPVAIVWLVLLTIAGNRVTSFRCPRCGQWFFAKDWYHNSFARRCLHCSLPKWAADDSIASV
jgi:hypothetical protein